MTSIATRTTGTLLHLTAVQTVYLEHCGGCHGINGISAPREVPSLRHQVPSFLCTREGRDYLIRLPNVALAPVSNRTLADLMNYVVFELGGAASAASAHAAPYSAAEVARLRARPLTGTGLTAYRARIVEDIISRCGAGAGLRAYDSGGAQNSPAAHRASEDIR